MSDEVSGTATARIFISYRRADTRHVAGRLFEVLGRRFGRANVFVDVHSLEPGRDFAAAIDQVISRCDVVLVLIGPRWPRDRLHDHSDLMRLEIQSALAADIRVIPVLVDGAEAIRQDELPQVLAPLARRNAVRLDHETFDNDVRPILHALGRSHSRRPVALGLGTLLIVIVAALLSGIPILTGGGSASGMGPSITTTPSPATTDPATVTTDPPTVTIDSRATITSVADAPGECSTTYQVAGDVSSDLRATATSFWLVMLLAADPDDGSPSQQYYAKTPVKLVNGHFATLLLANQGRGPTRKGRLALVLSPTAQADADLQKSKIADDAKDIVSYPDGRRIDLHLGNREVASTPFTEQRCT